MEDELVRDRMDLADITVFEYLLAIYMGILKIHDVVLDFGIYISRYGAPAICYKFSRRSGVWDTSEEDLEEILQVIHSQPIFGRDFSGYIFDTLISNFQMTSLRYGPLYDRCTMTYDCYKELADVGCLTSKMFRKDYWKYESPDLSLKTCRYWNRFENERVSSNTKGIKRANGRVYLVNMDSYINNPIDRWCEPNNKTDQDIAKAPWDSCLRTEIGHMPNASVTRVLKNPDNTKDISVAYTHEFFTEVPHYTKQQTKGW